MEVTTRYKNQHDVVNYGLHNTQHNNKKCLSALKHSMIMQSAVALEKVLRQSPGPVPKNITYTYLGIP
jgi:hypothetical protein